MNKSLTKIICFSLSIFLSPFVCSKIYAAESHLIVGTQDITWSYKGAESEPNKPLIVDDVKKGDIVEIKIEDGAIPHGFTTTSKNQPAAPDPTLVLVCGEAESAKPAAVLREVECGAASQFGVVYVGTMKLEVLDKFAEDINFWCTVHGKSMAGVLKLAQ